MDQVGALRETESGTTFLTEENPLWSKPFCALNLATVLALEQVPVMDDLREQMGKENGNPLRYFCLKRSMDREAWRAV